jgi:hypothetical protein
MDGEPGMDNGVRSPLSKPLLPPPTRVLRYSSKSFFVDVVVYEN